MLGMLRARGPLVVTTLLIRGVASASLAGRGTLVGTGTLGGLGRSDALRSLYPPIEPYKTVCHTGLEPRTSRPHTAYHSLI